MSDVAKTPREELECKNKYLYEYSMFWECNDGFKSQILEDDVVDLLNEQQELIEELQASDEMGWKRAEHFEKKCPKELHNQKMYTKRLEYKVQKLKEENMGLRAKHTQMVIIMKDVVKDLKRIDTYRYAEHLEKIANLRFLSEKELDDE